MSTLLLDDSRQPGANWFVAATEDHQVLQFTAVFYACLALLEYFIMLATWTKNKIYSHAVAHAIDETSYDTCATSSRRTH